MNENEKASNAIIYKRKRKQKNKKNNFKKILLSIFLVLILIVISSVGYTYFTLSKVKIQKIDTSDKALGINPYINQIISNSPINIALFGTDNRALNENGNSDTIMIASIDRKDKNIKLISIMRDSRVNVPGYGLYKINAAYMLGGPQLAVQTINSVYGLNIKSYISINMYNMIKIINSFGGVDINVQPYEISELNDYQRDIAKIENITPIEVTKGGLQHLNGLQAVGYSRIRDVGNGDRQRTERQRTVLSQLINKIKAKGILSYPSSLSNLLPYVLTNITPAEFLNDSFNAIGIKNIVQQTIPLESYESLPTINGIDYVTYDINIASQQIFNFIFKNITPKEQ